MSKKIFYSKSLSTLSLPGNTLSSSSKKNSSQFTPDLFSFKFTPTSTRGEFLAQLSALHALQSLANDDPTKLEVVLQMYDQTTALIKSMTADHPTLLESFSDEISSLACQRTSCVDRLTALRRPASQDPSSLSSSSPSSPPPSALPGSSPKHTAASLIVSIDGLLEAYNTSPHHISLLRRLIQSFEATTDAARFLMLAGKEPIPPQLAEKLSIMTNTAATCKLKLFRLHHSKALPVIDLQLQTPPRTLIEQLDFLFEVQTIATDTNDFDSLQQLVVLYEKAVDFFLDYPLGNNPTLIDRVASLSRHRDQLQSVVKRSVPHAISKSVIAERDALSLSALALSAPDAQPPAEKDAPAHAVLRRRFDGFLGLQRNSRSTEGSPSPQPQSQPSQQQQQQQHPIHPSTATSLPPDSDASASLSPPAVHTLSSSSPHSRSPSPSPSSPSPSPSLSSPADSAPGPEGVPSLTSSASPRPFLSQLSPRTPPPLPSTTLLSDSAPVHPRIKSPAVTTKDPSSWLSSSMGMFPEVPTGLSSVIAKNSTLTKAELNARIRKTRISVVLMDFINLPHAPPKSAASHGVASRKAQFDDTAFLDPAEDAHNQSVATLCLFPSFETSIWNIKAQIFQFKNFDPSWHPRNQKIILKPSHPTDISDNELIGYLARSWISEDIVFEGTKVDHKQSKRSSQREKRNVKIDRFLTFTCSPTPGTHNAVEGCATFFYIFPMGSPKQPLSIPPESVKVQFFPIDSASPFEPDFPTSWPIRVSPSLRFQGFDALAVVCTPPAPGRYAVSVMIGTNEGTAFQSITSILSDLQVFPRSSPLPELFRLGLKSETFVLLTQICHDTSQHDLFRATFPPDVLFGWLESSNRQVKKSTLEILDHLLPFDDMRSYLLMQLSSEDMWKFFRPANWQQYPNIARFVSELILSIDSYRASPGLLLPLVETLKSLSLSASMTDKRTAAFGWRALGSSQAINKLVPSPRSSFKQLILESFHAILTADVLPNDPVSSDVHHEACQLCVEAIGGMASFSILSLADHQITNYVIDNLVHNADPLMSIRCSNSLRYLILAHSGALRFSQLAVFHEWLMAKILASSCTPAWEASMGTAIASHFGSPGTVVNSDALHFSTLLRSYLQLARVIVQKEFQHASDAKEATEQDYSHFLLARLQAPKPLSVLCRFLHHQDNRVQSDAATILNFIAQCGANAPAQIFESGQQDLLNSFAISHLVACLTLLDLFSFLPFPQSLARRTHISLSGLTRLVDIMLTETYTYQHRKMAAKIVAHFFGNDASLRQHFVHLRGLGILQLFLKFDLPLSDLHVEIDPSELTRIKTVGAGATAEVWTSLYQGRVVAVKSFFTANSDFSMKVFREELLTMTILKHPNLVTAIGASTKSRGTLAIVTEFYCNGDLSMLFEREDYLYSPRWAIQFAIDFCDAMSTVHAAGLMHRDLKAENILLDVNWRIGITDFGTTRNVVNVRPRMSVVGTPSYMAPEMQQPAEGVNSRLYDQSIDVYSFALVLWELIFVKAHGRAFSNLHIFDLVPSVLGGLRPNTAFDDAFPNFQLYSSEEVALTRSLIELIENAWSAEPTQRPAFSKLFEEFAMLKHVYFGEGFQLSPPLKSPVQMFGHPPPAPAAPADTKEGQNLAETIKTTRQRQLAGALRPSRSQIRLREYQDRVNQFRHSIRITDPSLIDLLGSDPTFDPSPISRLHPPRPLGASQLALDSSSSSSSQSNNSSTSSPSTIITSSTPPIITSSTPPIITAPPPTTTSDSPLKTSESVLDSILPSSSSASASSSCDQFNHLAYSFDPQDLVKYYYFTTPRN